MAKIKTYRIDSNDVNRGEPEFYFKLNADNNKQLMNLGVDRHGLYYYRPSSQILTPGENVKTLNSWDGFLTMEEVKTLFENLRKIGWARNKEDKQEIKMQVTKKKIIIEIDE